MKRTIASIVASLAFMPLGANAGLIEYTVEGDSDAGWSLLGNVVIDEADIVAGVNLVPDFVSWTISWTDGIDTLTNTDGTSFFDAADFFIVDAALNVVSVNLCTGACDGTGANWPEVSISLISWNGSITPEGTCCLFGIPGQITAAWSGPQPVSTVPEPGTLALLGVGLAVAGFARRRRRA